MRSTPLPRLLRRSPACAHGWKSRSQGFYEWRSRPESATVKRRNELKLLIQKAFDDSDGTYGYRRVWSQLVRWGVPAGLELVRALMRELALVACRPRPWRPSTTQQARSPDTWSWRPPAYWRGAGWVLCRPLRQPHAGGQHTTLHKPARKESFPAPDDQPPLVGVQLVRPRRYAAAGADTSTLLVRVSPGERIGRLSFEDLMETASPGDGPGGLTPKRLPSPEDCLSARRGASRGLQRSGRLSTRFPARWCCRRRGQGEGDVLGVGIDWAEEFHVGQQRHRERGDPHVLISERGNEQPLALYQSCGGRVTQHRGPHIRRWVTRQVLCLGDGHQHIAHFPAHTAPRRRATGRRWPAPGRVRRDRCGKPRACAPGSRPAGCRRRWRRSRARPPRRAPPRRTGAACGPGQQPGCGRKLRGDLRRRLPGSPGAAPPAAGRPGAAAR